MKKNKLTIAMGLITSGLLIACGGEESSSPISQDNTSISAGGVIVITAVDGYYQNAVVFDDVDNDGELDVSTDTIFGLTNSNGQLSYEFTGSLSIQGSIALQTIIPGGTKQGELISYDADTYSGVYTVDTDYPGTALDDEMVLRAPSSSVSEASDHTDDDQSYTAVVSPISDLVAILSEDDTITDPENAAADALGINESELYQDYVEESNAETHKKAQILSASKANDESSYEEAATEVAEATAAEVDDMSEEEIADVTDVPVVIVDTSDETPTTTVIDNSTAIVENTKLTEIQTALTALNAEEGGTIEVQTYDVSALFSDTDLGDTTPTISLNDEPNATTTGVTVSLDQTTNILTVSATTEILAKDDLTFTLSIEDLASDQSTVFGSAIASFTLPIEALNLEPTLNTTTQTSIQSSISDWSLTEGESFSNSFAVSELFADTESDTLTYSTTTSSVNGLTISVDSENATVTVSGTLGTAGSGGTIIITASDSQHDTNTTTASFTLPDIQEGASEPHTLEGQNWYLLKIGTDDGDSTTEDFTRVWCDTYRFEGGIVYGNQRTPANLTTCSETADQQFDQGTYTVVGETIEATFTFEEEDDSGQMVTITETRILSLAETATSREAIATDAVTVLSTNQADSTDVELYTFFASVSDAEERITMISSDSEDSLNFTMWLPAETDGEYQLGSVDISLSNSEQDTSIGDADIFFNPADGHNFTCTDVKEFYQEFLLTSSSIDNGGSNVITSTDGSDIECYDGTDNSDSYAAVDFDFDTSNLTDGAVYSFIGVPKDGQTQYIEAVKFNIEWVAVTPTTVEAQQTSLQSTISDWSLTEGSSVSESFSVSSLFTDPNGDSLTYSASTTVDGLTVNVADSGTVTLSGTPALSDSGDYSITVEATDGENSTSVTFAVTISSAISTETTVSAMDGYYQNAVIFDDVDNDGELDIYGDTIFGLTDSNGQLTIDSAEITGTLALQTLIPDGQKQEELISYDSGTFSGIYTIDTDYPSTTLTDEIVLRTPSSGSSDTAVISPITDLVSIQIDNGLSEEEAESTVATALGISESALYEDYVENADDETHKKAQILSASKSYDEDGYGAAATEVAEAATEAVSTMTDEELTDITQVPVVTVDASGGTPVLTVINNSVATVSESKLNEIQNALTALNIEAGDTLEEQIYDISELISDDDYAVTSFAMLIPDALEEAGITFSFSDGMAISVSAPTGIVATDDLSFDLQLEDIASDGTILGYITVKFTISVQVNIDNIPQAIASAAEQTLGTELTSQNLSDVTQLSLSNITEYELSWIEVFPNLESLSISNSPELTSLDLSGLQLTSVDVSTLTNLTKLDLTDNQLTSIDVSTLTNLTFLDLWDNQLTSIDVSTLTNLTSLYLAKNQLTSIDVSELTNLTGLDLTDNQLTSIDVSALTNLTELNLWNNQLTSIDVSTLTNLTSLYLGNNQLTNIDVSTLTNLTELVLGNNQLTNIDVSTLTNLTSLYLGYNQLTSIDVSTLTNLASLDLGYNQLTSIDISTQENLNWFYWDGNPMTEDEITWPVLTVRETEQASIQSIIDNWTPLEDGVSFSESTYIDSLFTELDDYDLTYTATTTITGLTVAIDDNNQLTISGVPELSGLSEYSVTVEATDGESSASATFTVTVSSTAGTVTISSETTVSAMDGYYQNAVIFDDVDNDGELDLGTDTIFGLTDSSGQLTIDSAEITGSLALQTLTPDGQKQEELISYDSGTFSGIYTIDTDYPSTTLTDEIVLRTPSSGSSDTAVISPITDLVSIQIDNGLSEEEAESTVATALGISESALYEDYVENADDETHKKAQILSASKSYDEDGYGAAATEVAEAATEAVSTMTDEELTDITQVPVVTVDTSGGTPVLTVINNSVATVSESKLNEIQNALTALNIKAGDTLEEQTYDISELISDDDYTVSGFGMSIPDALEEAGITVGFIDGMTISVSAPTETVATDDLSFDLQLEDIASDGTILGYITVKFTISVQVNIDNIPQAIASAAEQTLGTELTSQNLSDVAQLSLSNITENELSWIEVFPNLESLSISNSPELTSLDLSGLQLTNVDVSTLTNLTSLNLWDNQLTSIDVSTLTNLTELDLSINQLTSIDVSTLTNLTELALWNNQLTSIDVSTLPNLTYLDLEENELTDINLSALTQLTTLYLSFNQLTSIDVSALTNLINLDLWDNQLTSIDISTLENLSWFYWDGNPMTEDEITWPVLTVRETEQASIQSIIDNWTPLEDSVSFSESTSIGSLFTELNKYGLTYTATTTVTGLTAAISNNQLTISGVPELSGLSEYSVTVEATDGESSASATFTVTVSSTASTGTISSETTVSAMDGYYQNAVIFDDVDNDGELDIYGDTIFGLTDSSGQLTIDSTEITGTLALQTLIPDGTVQTSLVSYDAQYENIYTVDTDFPDQTVSEEMVLLAPTSSEVISPVTDLVAIQMAEGLSEEEAKDAVAAALELDSSALYDDYIEKADTDDTYAAMHKKAQILATSKASNEPEDYAANLIAIAEAATTTTNEMVAEDIRDTRILPIIEVSDGNITTISNYKAEISATEVQELQTEINSLGVEKGQTVNGFASTLDVTELFNDSDITNGTATPTVSLQGADTDGRLVQDGVTIFINDDQKVVIESSTVGSGTDITFVLVADDYSSDDTVVGLVYTELTLPVSVPDNQFPEVNTETQNTVAQSIASWNLVEGEAFDQNQTVVASELFTDAENDTISYTATVSGVSGLTATITDNIVTLSGTPDAKDETGKLIIYANDGAHGSSNISASFNLPAVQEGTEHNTDTDNDGVEDDVDLFPLDESESVDTDGDGIGDNADTDDDGDGIEDSLDAFSLDSTEFIDSDNDGIGNNADTDDDEDGIEDTVDSNDDHDVVDVFYGINSFAALRNDGSVITWGEDESGGDSSTIAAELDGSVKVTDIFSHLQQGKEPYYDAFAAVREDGSVVTWGAATRGGNSSIYIPSPETEIDEHWISVSSDLDGSVPVTSIISGESRFAALREDGSAVTWGTYNAELSESISNQLDGTIDVVKIVATDSGECFAALRKNGSVISWNSYGDYCNDTEQYADATDISDIVSHQNILLAYRSDGALLNLNSNYPNSFGDIDNLLHGEIGIKQIVSHRSQIVVLQNDDSVVTWWTGDDCAPTAISVDSVLSETIKVEKLFSASCSIAAILDNGSVVTWGYGAGGGDSSGVASEVDGTINVTNIVASDEAYAALREDGSVVVWGNFTGTALDETTMSKLDGTVKVIKLYTSESAVFAALREDGSLITWGYPDHGGDSSSVANQLDGAVKVIDVIFSYSSVAALREDGSVVRWGYQLGSNSMQNDAEEISLKLDGTIKVTKIVTNGSAFSAIREDGSLVSWGYVNSGGDSRTVAAEINGSDFE